MSNRKIKLEPGIVYSPYIPLFISEAQLISDEQDELNARFKSVAGKMSSRTPSQLPAEPSEDSESKKKDRIGYTQWTSHNNKIFIPASESCKILIPGMYTVCQSQSIGVYFEKEDINNEELIRFDDSNIDKVTKEIELFWEREDVFQEFGFVFKRGILMWGPPGTGKSCTIRLVMEDVIKRGGIVINFHSPGIFIEGMKILRSIQPDTPCVVLMEDIDSILDNCSESEVINILDGVQKIHKVVFLATTNYPERLGARICNRPSRFDRRYKIGNLNHKSRIVYFEHLFDKNKQRMNGHDIDQWAKDTKDLSISHLKELFVSVIILGDKYEEAIKILHKMRDQLKDEDKGKFGFAPNKEEEY